MSVARAGTAVAIPVNARTAKWWTIAFASGCVAFALVAAFSPGPAAWSSWGVWITLAVLVACFYSFGYRAFANDRIARVFLPILVIGCGVLAACNPTLSAFQALAMPLIWYLVESTRLAILVNVFVALAVALGYLVGLGWTIDVLTQAIVIEALSLLFSIALGLWITAIAHSGNEHARLLAELTAVQDELAAANRESGVASERERLAREIHDTIAQSLTSLVMLAQRAHAELGDSDAAGAAIAESIELMESTARDALTDARSLVSALAPLPGGDSSLADVVTRLAARFERETGVRVTAAVTATGIPRDLEVVLLRCTQEGLANVRKHARASEARVTIQQAGDAVRLEVRDDGRGLAGYSPQDDNGFGLSGMRDRVSLVGGRLEISGQPGTGTTLAATIPLTTGVTA